MDRPWRLILDEAHYAAQNMARDEAIFRACAQSESPPAIRIYGWSRPSLSLGYFQRLDSGQIDLDYCRHAGIDIVRRPTGGRAVLHGHDVTFSIAMSESDLPEGMRGINASHIWLMGFIAEGFRLLEICAEIGQSSSLTVQDQSADCFAHIAACDLRIGNNKIAGAAQLRRGGALLVQGSIPCTAPIADSASIFGGDTESQPVLNLPVDRVRAAIAQGFYQVFGKNVEQVTLSDNELDDAIRLERARYMTEEWTYRRGRLRIDNNM